RGARTAALGPGAAEGGAQAEEDEGGGEGRVGRTEPPGGIGEELLDRAVERAPRVDRADADVDEDGPDGNAPAMLRHAPDLLRMGERAQPGRRASAWAGACLIWWRV